MTLDRDAWYSASLTVAVAVLLGIFTIPDQDVSFSLKISIDEGVGIFYVIFSVAYIIWRQTRGGKTSEPPIKVEFKLPDPSPVLDLRPLPHYKGYMLPLKVEVKDLGDGKKEATATNVGASAPEYGLIESSQILQVAKGPIDQTMNEILAKFGVVRVHCVSGDAFGCRAEAKVRIVQMYGQMHPTNWLDVGYLDWFSMAIKRDIQQNRLDEIYPAKHLGMNKYLQNSSIDLHQGDEKDLLIFYMIKDIPNVFLCTDVESAQAGHIFSPGQTLKFEIEVGLTAQRYPKDIWRYMVTINDFDDFNMVSE